MGDVLFVTLQLKVGLYSKSIVYTDNPILGVELNVLWKVSAKEADEELKTIALDPPKAILS